MTKPYLWLNRATQDVTKGTSYFYHLIIQLFHGRMEAEWEAATRGSDFFCILIKANLQICC